MRFLGKGRPDFQKEAKEKGVSYRGREKSFCHEFVRKGCMEREPIHICEGERGDFS